MEKETKQTLSAFAQKAMQRLQDRKVFKTQKLHIPSLDEEITIRSLNREEIIECMGVEDTESDPDRSDRYTIYLAVKEPNLKELATIVKEQGEIVEYMDIVGIFEMHERVSIARAIMELSGVIGTKKVAVVNELKNS